MTSLVNGAGWYLLHPLWIEENYDAQARSMTCETRRLPPQADATKEMACEWIRQVDHLFGAGICHHSAVPPVQSHRSMACETRRLPPQRAARTHSVIMLPPCCLMGNVRTDRPSVDKAVDNVG